MHLNLFNSCNKIQTFNVYNESDVIHDIARNNENAIFDTAVKSSFFCKQSV